MHTAFVLKQTCFHTEKVVAFCLFEIRVFRFQKKLARFQIVVGVKFVTDGDRHDVQFKEIVDSRFSTLDCEHLDEAFLSGVAAVFGASLALCNPNRLMLLRDGEVDVARQLFGSAESLADIKVAFNDYAFVDSYEVLNPFVDKKVAADCHFRGAVVVVEQGEV